MGPGDGEEVVPLATPTGPVAAVEPLAAPPMAPTAHGTALGLGPP
jgi:hypothetical protein